MIIIRNTENLAGVEISGDFYDFNDLYDALHVIAISEESDKHTQYIDISTRLLGFCYDLRHAFQGDREVDLVDNMMNEEIMAFHSTIMPKNNVYYKFNYLYPEMMFVMLAMNALVNIRIRELAKSKYDEAFDRNVIWDNVIWAVRGFQAAFAKCVKNTLTQNSYARWQKFMSVKYSFIEDICGQYIDIQNIKYIALDKENRLKRLNTFAKRIAEFRYDAEHDEIKEVVTEAAIENSCQEGDILLEGLEYPDHIEW